MGLDKQTFPFRKVINSVTNYGESNTIAANDIRNVFRSGHYSSSKKLEKNLEQDTH